MDAVDTASESIINLQIDEEVCIVAYAHERRWPGYWALRIED